MSTLKTISFVIAASIGFLLASNGLIHSLLYLFDDKPFLDGLRYINWLSLFLGTPLTVYCIDKLSQSAPTVAKAS